MADQEQEHHHYFPDGLIPLTPQARRLGFTMPVYTTNTLWCECLVWSGKQNSNTDRRIFEMLKSSYEGLMKNFAARGEDFVSFKFKHFYWERDRPQAKKQKKIKLGGRLLLHPDDQEPWLLLFDPETDFENILTKGEFHGEPAEEGKK